MALDEWVLTHQTELTRPVQTVGDSNPLRTSGARRSFPSRRRDSSHAVPKWAVRYRKPVVTVLRGFPRPSVESRAAPVPSWLGWAL